MVQATQPYKRSLSGSVGAGMKSVFGGEGRRFYTLVHKVSSKYHKAGESQQIIVDQIELGRDPRCQVRFDDSFETVSRRHAAIVKDGDNWKLVQLSQTNSTYLNGHKVEKEWYLQNGDEIQLSTNGPKLGFIVPEGKKGLVSSINLTARLNLFRQQALRPYKTAITVLSCVLVLAACTGGWVIFNQSKHIADQDQQIIVLTDKNTEHQEKIDELTEQDKQNREKIAGLEGQISKLKKTAQAAMDRAAEAEKKAASAKDYHGDVNLSALHPNIFLIKCYKITVDGEVWAESKDWLMCGTGFLLDDGKFVTARHVSDPAFYSNDYGFSSNGSLVFNHSTDPEVIAAWIQLNAMACEGYDVVFHFKAVSTSKSFEFTSKNFKCDRSHDKIYRLDGKLMLSDVAGTRLSEDDVVLPAGMQLRSAPTGSYDWSYIETNARDGLKADREGSVKLQQGTTLYILGYPNGWGEGKPILSTAICSQNGLSNSERGTGLGGTIMASNDNTEGGNSGGPIFVKNGDNFEVVAIVSGGTRDKGRFVPIKVIP